MRAYTRPLMVACLGGAQQVCQALEDLPLRPGSTGALYDEGWLQRLIQEHPSLLPIADIEPALVQVVPVCLELPVPSGYIDNLMLTPDGGIVVVETKLWRNPEARREVIGQVLDYAKDLAGFSYEDLQRAVGIARKDKAASLFDLVCGDGDADEARFVDAVSRNLRLGRVLMIIAGDGIQESAEQLADFLQRHVGLHFTLSLVEMSLWRHPTTGEVLVQPRILTRTVQIERAVVRVESGVSLAPARIEAVSPAASRPMTLSDEAYYEALARVEPSLPAKLKAFLTEVEPLGVTGDVRRNLALRWHAPDGRVFHLGVIDLDGRISTDYCQASADAIGRLDLSDAYQERLASLIPGAYVKKTPKHTGWRVVGADDRNPPVAVLLARPDAWAEAIADYLAALERALQAA